MHRLIERAGLVDFLNDPRREVNLFAPNNAAWEAVEEQLPKPLSRCALIHRS